MTTVFFVVKNKHLSDLFHSNNTVVYILFADSVPSNLISVNALQNNPIIRYQ